MNSTEIRELFSDISKRASSEGASVELEATSSESFGVNYSKQNLEEYSSDLSQNVGIRVLFEKGAGYATTENLSKDAVLNCYQEALQSAKDLNLGADSKKIPQKLWKGPVPKPLAGLLHPPSFEREIDAKLQDAKTLEKSALDFHADIASVPYSHYGESKGKRLLLNSLGLDVESEGGGISAYSYVLAKKGEDSKMSGTGGFYRQLQKFSAEKMGKKAAQKALELLGATQPKTGKYTIVLRNKVASSIVPFLFGHVSAKTLDESRSLLKGKIGQKVLSPLLTIEDDPFFIEGSSARAFDGEGAASQKTTVFKEGVFQNFLTNSYLAEKLNLPHTAHAVRNGGEMGVGPSNVIFKNGTKSLEDLLAAEKNVIFITSLEAAHSGFKTASLDFSMPGAGFVYENGELKGALHQFVVSGNLLQWLHDVQEMSHRQPDQGESVVISDLLIPDVSIAGA